MGKIIHRNYTTIDNNKTNQDNKSLDPWFVTGLFDAESSFVVTILKNPRYTTGWYIQASLQIKMHEKDRALIESIKLFFCDKGNLSNKANSVEFRISSLKDLVDVVIPHFDNFPLITKKYSDYLLFKEIVTLMKNKEHSSLIGIQKAVAIRASLNWGLPPALKEAFPDTIPVKRLEEGLLPETKLDPNWVAGFCTGESNFFIAKQKSKTNSGLSVWVRFSISQHSRDLVLMENFANFFGGGYLANYTKRPLCEFFVAKIDVIIEQVIPFFEKHPILGSKHLNYLDFKTAAYIIKNKEHLSQDGVGLNRILRLK